MKCCEWDYHNKIVQFLSVVYVPSVEYSCIANTLVGMYGDYIHVRVCLC